MSQVAIFSHERNKIHLRGMICELIFHQFIYESDKNITKHISQIKQEHIHTKINTFIGNCQIT